jgi:hypothetical protein
VLEKELSEAESLLQQMDLEVRSMSGALRSELQTKVRGYKTTLSEMKQRTCAYERERIVMHAARGTSPGWPLSAARSSGRAGGV